jgi:outer membrane protein assembly factor BamB
VAGALIERHDGRVRAVDLARGTTWWSISRSDRVQIESVGRVDDRHVAVVWSDRRLTVVEVSSGHRVHVKLPDRSAANVSYQDPWRSTEPTVGLTGPAGRPLVAVVQPFGVDTYDASSGRRVWSSRPAPRGCILRLPPDVVQQEVSALSLDVACADDNATDSDPYDKNAYSTLLDAASGQPLPHFERFQYGSLDPIGDHEFLQDPRDGNVELGYRVVDSRTGGVLWNVECTSEEQATGGAGLVVVSRPDTGQITAYRAADGTRLWQHTFGDDGVSEIQVGLVIEGQVRAIAGSLGSYRVATLNAAGGIEGTQDLPMFYDGGDPRLVGGDDATLVVESFHTYLYDYPEPPYVLLTASR